MRGTIPSENYADGNANHLDEKASALGRGDIGNIEQEPTAGEYQQSARKHVPQSDQPLEPRSPCHRKATATDSPTG